MTLPLVKMAQQADDRGPKTEQAKRLVSARVAAGYAKAREACRAFGWNYDTYIQHERGNRTLRFDVAKRYADAFNAPVAWLMVEAGARAPALLDLARQTTAGEPGLAESSPQSPPPGPAAGAGSPATDIVSIPALDRDGYRLAARKAIEFALVSLRDPNGLPAEEILRLAAAAAQFAFAEQALKFLQRTAGRRNHKPIEGDKA